MSAQIIDGVDSAIQDEFDRLWLRLDSLGGQVDCVEVRLTKEPWPPVVHPRQLAPAPDYSLASDDLGDFSEPTQPGYALLDPPEACSCDEALALRALLREARELVGNAHEGWHRRVAALF
jgi:hypothetical protein